MQSINPPISLSPTKESINQPQINQSSNPFQPNVIYQSISQPINLFLIHTSIQFHLYKNLFIHQSSHLLNNPSIHQSSQPAISHPLCLLVYLPVIFLTACMFAHPSINQPNQSPIHLPYCILLNQSINPFINSPIYPAVMNPPAPIFPHVTTTASTAEESTDYTPRTQNITTRRSRSPEFWLHKAVLNYTHTHTHIQ